MLRILRICSDLKDFLELRKSEFPPRTGNLLYNRLRQENNRHLDHFKALFPILDTLKVIHDKRRLSHFLSDFASSSTGFCS